MEKPDFYRYIALLDYEEDGVHVTFPDLPGCVTAGENEADAIKAARDVLALHLWGMEEGSLFHHLFNDGKPHFVIIRKDGEDVAVGFFHACSNPQNDKEELSITEYPEYREEWNRVKEGEKDSYLYITEQTYFDVSSGLTVIETQYPPEWLNDDQKKDSEEPVKDETAESSDAKAC